MKHHNNDGTITFIVDAEAANMIDRAISNYFKFTQRETGAMRRFKELIIFGQIHALIKGVGVIKK